MTEWISQDTLCKKLGISQIRLGFLLDDGALPRAKWNGTATLWDWEEVVGSKFVRNQADYSAPIKYSGPSLIYFIELHEFIKIGHAQSVANRLGAIQCASPYKVKLLHSMPGGRVEEARIHHIFADDRVRGEWFRKTARLLALIEFFKTEDAETNRVRDGKSQPVPGHVTF